MTKEVEAFELSIMIAVLTHQEGIDITKHRSQPSF